MAAGKAPGRAGLALLPDLGSPIEAGSSCLLHHDVLRYICAEPLGRGGEKNQKNLSSTL
jgi:hypothetical protein